MGLQMFLSLVARAATLGNSCNLHKCKMAAIDSGLRSPPGSPPDGIQFNRFT